MLSKYLSHGYRGNCGSLCCYSFYKENAVNERGVNVKQNASVEIKGSIRIGILLATITFFMLCTSCEALFTDQFWGTRPVYPRYTPSYAYQLLLEDVRDESRPYTEGKYLYLIEYEKRGGSRLIKLDMETGAYQWYGDRMYEADEGRPSNIVKIGDVLYVMRFERGLLYCYSDTNGALLARVQIGSTKEEILHNRSVSNTIMTDGTALYWAADKGDIVKLDATAIDCTKGWVIQICPPVPLQLNAHWNGNRLADQQLIEGILYLLAYTSNGSGIVVAVDLQTKTVNWQRQLDNINMNRYYDNELYIKDDVLYVLTNSFIRIDKRDGSILNRYDGEIVPPSTDPVAESTISLCRVRCSNERLYYIAVRDFPPYKWQKDDYWLICIDAVTLQRLWSVPLENASYSTPLTVANGKIYIIKYSDGLLVFDAKTGKLHGADKTVSGWGNGINVLYKNHYIFFNRNFNDKYASISSMRV